MIHQVIGDMCIIIVLAHAGHKHILRGYSFQAHGIRMYHECIFSGLWFTLHNSKFGNRLNIMQCHSAGYSCMVLYTLSANLWTKLISQELKWVHMSVHCVAGMHGDRIVWRSIGFGGGGLQMKRVKAPIMHYRTYIHTHASNSHTSKLDVCLQTHAIN